MPIPTATITIRVETWHLGPRSDYPRVEDEFFKQINPIMKVFGIKPFKLCEASIHTSMDSEDRYYMYLPLVQQLTAIPLTDLPKYYSLCGTLTGFLDDVVAYIKVDEH